jgi:hypothetical protein
LFCTIILAMSSTDVFGVQHAGSGVITSRARVIITFTFS